MWVVGQCDIGEAFRLVLSGVAYLSLCHHCLCYQQWFTTYQNNQTLVHRIVDRYLARRNSNNWGRAILEHGKKMKIVGVKWNEQQSILRKIDCCSF